MVFNASTVEVADIVDSVLANCKRCVVQVLGVQLVFESSWVLGSQSNKSLFDRTIRGFGVISVLFSWLSW